MSEALKLIMSDLHNCPFCHLSDRLILAESEHAMAIEDAYPVSPGHALVLPRRHLLDLFDLKPDELAEIFALVGQIKRQLAMALSPEGFNVGVNIGKAAGQTILHAHVHVIPRYQGDVSEPLGGVRNVIPGRGRYEP